MNVGVVARPGMTRERAAAVALVLVACTSPQIGAAFAVTLFDELGPAGAAFLRLIIAAIVLWLIWRPHLAGDLRLAAAFGVSLGLMNWTFYEAISRIPLAIAVTIEFAGPLLVAVVGSRRPLDVVWVGLAAIGIVLLVNPGGGSLDPVGVGFALAAAGCWMAYIYLSKRTGAAFPGGAGLAIAMAVGALVVLPAGALRASTAFAEPELLGTALIVALASSVLPYSLELVALRRLPAAVFGVLMSLDPAVAAVVGFIALHQDLGPREVLAIAMVVVASAGAASLSHRPERPNDDGVGDRQQRTGPQPQHEPQEAR
ncbi:MAG TPA: DMT family transporter [Candidatus Limnocylindrales bacterium]|nr:DMT family transporter [Candidatus Limnocylindrales bacterium]